MSNPNLIGVYLKQEDEDLREALKGYDNMAKAEIVKKALRVYLSNEKTIINAITSAPGKPCITQQDPDTVKQMFEVQGRELLVLRSIH